MLSNDLFSYLDSDEPPSPLGFGRRLSEDQDVQHFENVDLLSDFGDENSELTENGDKFLEPTSVLTASAKQSQTIFSGNFGSERQQRVIEMAMGSDQEDDLVKYLTGQYEERPPPCLMLVRKSQPDLSRAPSPSLVSKRDTESEGGLCMSRNAIAARETRQRKKQHMEKLEDTVKTLRLENVNLKNETKHMKTQIKELKDEVCYLKSVLANQSVLAGLLQNIQNTPGVKFQSSLVSDAKEKRVRAKKPTATVNGTVKLKSSKRKPCEELTSLDKDKEAFVTSKKAKHDHGYAAEPRGIRDPQMSAENCVPGCDSVEMGFNSSDEAVVCGENYKEASAGVCLHVSKGSVSFEFCALCSEKASRVSRTSDVLMSSGDVV